MLKFKVEDTLTKEVKKKATKTNNNKLKREKRTALLLD